MIFQVRTRRFYPRSERQADWLNAETLLRLAGIQTLGLYLLVNFLSYFPAHRDFLHIYVSSYS